MKYLLLLALAVGAPSWKLLTWVHDRNTAVADGTAAYGRGDAVRASASFQAALAAKVRRAPDPRLVLNLGHAQTRAGQTALAQATYARLLAGSPAALSSVARQQLAVQAAQKGEIAQALTLLRQALLLDPRNSGARYDYEVLSDYLAKRPNAPKIEEPQLAPRAGAPKPAPKQNGAAQNQPAEKAGTDRPGEINDQKPSSPAPNTPIERKPNPAGQTDNRQPTAAPGNAATGGRTPGAGPPEPVASGATPGNQRGLDRRSSDADAGSTGRSNRLGTDAATAGDAQLQTQRERLEAMNLSPAQARQLLETLRAQEQQYLQQLTRPATQKPDPRRPTW